MSCLGVFFALSEPDERRLLLYGDQDDEVLELVEEDFEHWYEEEWKCQVDKSWDAIHRCLSGGQLNFDGTDVLSKVVLGGRQLHSESNYIVAYKAAKEVRQISTELSRINADVIRASY